MEIHLTTHVRITRRHHAHPHDARQWWRHQRLPGERLIRNSEQREKRVVISTHDLQYKPTRPLTPPSSGDLHSPLRRVAKTKASTRSLHQPEPTQLLSLQNPATHALYQGSLLPYTRAPLSRQKPLSFLDKKSQKCIAKLEKIGERWNQSLVSFPSLDTPATAARLGRFFVGLGIQGVDSQFQRYELVDSMDLRCRI
jgi:hypothetical protein